MTLSRRFRFIRHASAAFAAASLALAAPAGAAESAGVAQAGQPGYVPGEVVVRVRDPRTGAIEARRHVIRDGDSVRETARELERRPGVVSATPNFIARASGWIPNDPGRDGVPGRWRALQWNLLGETGINAPDAWETLIRAGRPGGRGVVVAVLYTGFAYRTSGRFRKCPDLAACRFVRA